MIYNDFFEHALKSTTDQYGNELWKCEYQGSTKFYLNSKNNNKNYIDIDEPIYDEDASGFCTDLKRAGITEFTYSLEFNACQSIAMKFEQNGFKLVGLTYFKEVETIWNAFDGNQKLSELSQIPTYKEKYIPTLLFRLS